MTTIDNVYLGIIHGRRATLKFHPHRSLGWYIASNAVDEYDGRWGIEMRSVIRYLHNDGEWRESTNHQGHYTGYFKTPDDAVMVAEREKQKDQEVSDGDHASQS